MRSLILLAALALPASAEDLSGVYRCDERACSLTLTRVGDVYRLRWSAGEDGGSRLGIGILEGDRLSVSCCVGSRNTAALVYAVGKGRKLTGRGATFPGDGRLARESYTYEKPLPWRAPARRWRVGERVLAAWSADEYWYPATVQRVEGDRFLVAYQDGSEEWTDASLIAADDIREGDRVSARWQKTGPYYDGTVKARRGDVLEIAYDDGDAETAMISAVRVKRPREAAERPRTRL